MGFLNFRKRNKNTASRTLKCKLPELTFEQSGSNDETDSGSSSASFSSPIADSFMMASSIPNLTTTSLLEDILSELPDPVKIKPLTYNANEKLTTVNSNVPYSSNLKTNNGKKSTNTAVDQYSKNSMDNRSTFVNNNVAVKHLKEQVSTTTTFKNNGSNNQQSTFNNNFIKASLSPSESKSMSPKISTEKLVPLRDIFQSDPRLYSTIRTIASEKKAADIYPLVDFSAAKYTANSTVNLKTYGDKINTKKESNSSSTAINNNLTSAQQPSGFTIDRMKERHRKEYRRSLQWTPTALEPKVTHVRRASSLITSNNINGNHQRNLFAQSQQQKYSQPQVFQQHNPIIHETFSRNEQHRVIVVPMTSKSVTPLFLNNTHMTPAKSFSTSQYNRSLPAEVLNSGSYKNKSFTMKPIIENISLPTKTRSTSTLKNTAMTPRNCCKNTHVAHKSSCYTTQVCHAKRLVTQAQNLYRNENCTFDQQIKISPRADNFCNLENPQSSDNNEQAAAFGTSAAGLTKLDGVLFVNCMRNSPKLKKEYRHMQQIHRKKCYSVPNLSLFLDNDKDTDKIQLFLRKLFETTRPVALISKGSDLKRKKSNNSSSITIKDKSITSHPCKQYHFHENRNNCKYCHHVSSKCKQNRTSSCCHQIKQTGPTCCCNSRTRHHNERSKIITPSENSKFSTSLGPLKQPHDTVQNVGYDSLKTKAKNPHCNQQILRPVCQTCRH